jgi:hypothetical protein
MFYIYFVGTQKWVTTPDIKCFSNVRTVRFYPIKDKNLLIEEGFS